MFNLPFSWRSGVKSAIDSSSLLKASKVIHIVYVGFSIDLIITGSSSAMTIHRRTPTSENVALLRLWAYSKNF